jgi:transporter family protein
LTTELLTVLAAFGFAASQVSMKLGLQGTTILAGVLIGMVSALTVLAVGGLLLSPPETISGTGLLLFASAGLLAPGITRWAATVSIHRFGPSITVPITQGTRPLFGLAAAAIILGETLTVNRVVGALSIVAGGWRLSTSEEEETGKARRRFPRRKLRPGFVLPVLAGIAFAASDILVKSALNRMSEPIFGAMIGMTVATFVWVTPSLSLPRLRGKLTAGNKSWWFVLSGVLQGLGFFGLYSALQRGDVSLVAPILAAQPLAVFLLSRLFIRHLEGLNPGTVIAGCLIVAGTIIVTL